MIIRFTILLFLFSFLTGCQFMSQPAAEQPIIVFTFDDGMESVWNYALPVFEEFGYTATNFVSSGLLNTPGYLTWEQVEALEFEKGWETGGHSLYHRDLCTLNYAQADSAIGVDFRNLKNHGLNITSFALPNGQCPAEYMNIIRNYYEYIRNSADNPSSQPVNEHLIGEFPYRSSFRTSDVTNHILDGISNHESMVIIGFHSVKPSSPSAYNCTPAELHNILSWVHEQHLQVRTLQDAMDTIK